MKSDFTLKIPAGLPKGEHRILFSDADTLNRMQSVAAMSEPLHGYPANRFADQSGTQQQQALHFAGGARPTVFYEDKTLPSLPASIMNVMQTDRTASRHLQASSESAIEQGSIPFDMLIDGSYSLRITVK